MPELGAVVDRIRSKNAGPFWVTIDVFCGDGETFAAVCAALDTDAVADRFGVAADAIRRFEIADLAVLKLSLPRPAIQGTPEDRDMHGAGWAALLAEMPIRLMTGSRRESPGG